jgi:hypothetical protein
MITPETIITPELLAGLDKCPFCGEENWYKSEGQIRFRCKTGFMVGGIAAPSPLGSCECKYLRARVQELRARVRRLMDAGDEMESVSCRYGNAKWRKAKGGA